tara:strand:- start:2666 stop:2839 length:174 start_codon:yes stop_codon:yes gene_type:complete
MTEIVIKNKVHEEIARFSLFSPSDCAKIASAWVSSSGLKVTAKFKGPRGFYQEWATE